MTIFTHLLFHGNAVLIQNLGILLYLRLLLFQPRYLRNLGQKSGNLILKLEVQSAMSITSQ